jgi:NADH-quinone oxidoreductase subunit N
MFELLIFSGLGIVAMLSEIFNARKGIFAVALIGFAAILGLCYFNWGQTSIIDSHNMLVVDKYSRAFTAIFTTTAMIWFLMSKSYFEDETNMSDHFALILFALAGGFILVSFKNMTMLFLGVEILSIPLYVLVGSRKTDLASNEGAFKYFLMGAFASAFLLFGIAFVYGATGSFDIEAIGKYVTSSNGNVSMMFIVGVLMILAAMSFKVGAVPFHFWTPDVYQGAPTLITAFMATIVKTVAFAAFFRLFIYSFVGVEHRFADVLWAIAALTILIGNLGAVMQNDAKRTFAYSSIGHAGFMMIGILVLNNNAGQAILYYSAAYSAATLAAFLVLFNVSNANGGDTSIAAFNGLVKRNPLLAGTMTMALLSMAGIPPLSGFFAKYFIFINALTNGYVGLTVMAILGSLIGVYYYFKILIAMFNGTSDAPNIEISATHKALLILLNLIIVLLGLLPQYVLTLM